MKLHEDVVRADAKLTDLVEGDLVLVDIIKNNYWQDRKPGIFLGFTKTGKVRVRIFGKTKSFDDRNVVAAEFSSEAYTRMKYGN